MYELKSKDLTLMLDVDAGHISSLVLNGQERICGYSPIFKLRIRKSDGTPIIVTAYDAHTRIPTSSGAIYTDFVSDNYPEISNLSVQIYATSFEEELDWRIAVTSLASEMAVEYTDFPIISLPLLTDNCKEKNGGKILLPYNEGVIISDATAREETALRYMEPEYPSLGSYMIFPNMLSSQFMAYLWNDTGLYIGAHDSERGVKGLDFISEENSVILRLRTFCGCDFGEEYTQGFPIVFSAVEKNWESAAERYRTWFENSLPSGVKKISDNKELPLWYKDAPLIVSYPIRGKFDMDEMLPNGFYPYTNALPLIKELNDITNSRLLVLLMHWEGTAPWAPPYVWPPYGDIDNFNSFKEELHDNDNLLGVYCSGFGYTLQSNLIAEYSCKDIYESKKLQNAMCAAPNGEIAISKICTGQRSGYDICPASPKGQEILCDAYTPLFENGLDYVQILDQNHGGGQYFCYSKEHGHPPVPGTWMTSNMQDMLSDWNKKAPNTLFGCESAAAEPFIGNLLFSDNRFELNYKIGMPVPLYSYIYHEYLRNFMGNQVSCPFKMSEDTLQFRIAYSFAAGDCMTLVLSPDGEIMSHWGMRDFSHMQSKETILTLIKNLTRFYKEKAMPYLYNGRMIPSLHTACESITFGRRDSERRITVPTVYTSAWEADDKTRAQIFVNPTEHKNTCYVNGKAITIPPLNAVLLPL